MIQDVLTRENMIFRNIYKYLNDKEDIVDIQDIFRDAKNFKKDFIRPKKVHTFTFRNHNLINIFNEYKELFEDYPYFKVNITQAKLMPYITYKLKDKDLIESDKYKEFKKIYNETYGKHLVKLADKTSREQCYRLLGTIEIDDIILDDDATKWMDNSFNKVFEIK